MSKMDSKNLGLGFDIGTSSLKLVVYNFDTNSTELELNNSTQSSRISNENLNINEQNVDIILKLVEEIFEQVPKNYFPRIKGIQICGQVIPKPIPKPII